MGLGNRINDDSLKGALRWTQGGEHSRTTKDAKFGEIGKYFSLRSWCPFGGDYPDKGSAQGRLGAKNFVDVVLLNILSVRIYCQSDSDLSP